MDVPPSEWIVRTMFRHQEYLRQHGKKPEGPAGLEPPKEQGKPHTAHKEQGKHHASYREQGKPHTAHKEQGKIHYI